MASDTEEAPAADRRSLERLLEVLRISDRRESYEREIKQEQAAGRSDAELVTALSGLPGITGLEALRASRQVVDILTNARWHMIRQAREEGSSWREVGKALGMSKQAAYDFYRRKLVQQEHAPAEAYDVPRNRAALGDDSNA
jgi:hypothetical protein